MKIITLFTMLIAMVTTTLNAAEKEVALDGYCPVCYIAAGKANKGDAQFAAEHDGKTYHFVNEEIKQMFLAEPAKFLPQFNGLCAYGIAKGKEFKADPTQFTVVDGKIYLNKDAEIAKLFKADTAALIKDADAKWPTLKAAMMKKEEQMMKEKEMKAKEAK